MPQRRINTPIPSFSAGWGEWTPIVLTWYDVGGVGTAPPANPVTTLGRYRVFTGMVEFELWVSFIRDVADTSVIFEVPLPVASGLIAVSNSQFTYNEQDMLDIVPATPAPAAYGGFGVCSGGAIDCIRNVLNSGVVGALPSEQRHIHLSGYYPVAIP